MTAAQVASLYYSDAAQDLIFADVFKPGNFAATAAALAETTGADELIDDVARLVVQDDRPVDASRHRARFHIDPSRFDPGETQRAFRAQIFLAFDASPQRRLIVLVLKREGGNYALMGTTRLDDATQVSTPFVPITAAPHAVEFGWRQSSAPGANNGSFQLWIDGVLMRRCPTWTTTRKTYIGPRR